MIEEKESDFVEDLTKYENKWIALIESEGAKIIVGSGVDADEAMREAEAKGFADAYLYKVFPFDRGYIPLTGV